nr:MAG TPA: hypothetical protein [Caudoviricetes sp.]
MRFSFLYDVKFRIHPKFPSVNKNAKNILTNLTKGNII